VNKFGETLFWIVTILLGFVNPLISIALVVVYYLPKIIQDLCQPCNEIDFEMNSYSDDILEDMK